MLSMRMCLCISKLDKLEKIKYMARLCIRTIRTDFMLKRPVAKFRKEKEEEGEEKWRSTILIKLEFVRVKHRFNVRKRKHTHTHIHGAWHGLERIRQYNKPPEKHVFHWWIRFSSRTFRCHINSADFMMWTEHSRSFEYKIWIWISNDKKLTTLSVCYLCAHTSQRFRFLCFCFCFPAFAHHHSLCLCCALRCDVRRCFNVSSVDSLLSTYVDICPVCERVSGRIFYVFILFILLRSALCAVMTVNFMTVLIAVEFVSDI